jgi:hypothetical protein
MEDVVPVWGHYQCSAISPAPEISVPGEELLVNHEAA